METAAEAGLPQHLGEAALVSCLATVTTDSLSQAGLTPVEHEQKPMVGRKIYFSLIGSLEKKKCHLGCHWQLDGYAEPWVILLFLPPSLVPWYPMLNIIL